MKGEELEKQVLHPNMSLKEVEKWGCNVKKEMGE